MLPTISHCLHLVINSFDIVVNGLRVLYSVHRLLKDYLHILRGCHAVYMKGVRYDADRRINTCFPPSANVCTLSSTALMLSLTTCTSLLTTSTFSSTRVTPSSTLITMLSILCVTFRSCALAIATSSLV